MSIAELVEELRELGIGLQANGGFLHVTGRRSLLTPKVIEELGAAKPALMEYLRDEGFPGAAEETSSGEVRWRVEAMNRRIPAEGPLPLLVVRDLPRDSGGCVSCGEPIPDGRCRCNPCVAAAWIVCRRDHLREPGAGLERSCRPTNGGSDQPAKLDSCTSYQQPRACPRPDRKKLSR